MIDTRKMLDSVERLERVFGGEVRATQSIGELVEILTRLRQAEKDAARYRWLRNEASMTDMQDFSFSLTSERDAFMDDAMQCGGDNK